jgi:hypothetical protein
MSHHARFPIVGGLLVILGGCSDTLPSAPALAPSPPQASAIGKPTRSPVPFETIAFAAGELCSFAVVLEFPVSQYVAKTFPPKPNGDVVEISTGRVLGRFTNVSTGTSFTYNISGPTRITFHADGSATLEAPGPQGVANIINWGRIVIEVSPDGVFTIVKQTGHSEDVCAALS